MLSASGIEAAVDRDDLVEIRVELGADREQRERHREEDRLRVVEHDLEAPAGDGGGASTQSRELPPHGADAGLAFGALAAANVRAQSGHWPALNAGAKTLIAVPRRRPWMK